MASLNKVLLIGNLTRDPEIRYTPAQKAVGDLRLAVSRRFKGTDGQMKEDTCFVSVVVWERQAEVARDYLRKGAPVLIEGRLQYEEWEKDGQKFNRLRVRCERLQLMGSPRGEGREGGEGGGMRRSAGGREEPAADDFDEGPSGSGPAPRAAAPSPAADAGPAAGDKRNADEDDLPF